MTATTPTPILNLTMLCNIIGKCIEGESYAIYVDDERAEDIEAEWDEQDVIEICLSNSRGYDFRFDTITRIHENAIEVEHTDGSKHEIVFIPAGSDAMITDVINKCGTDCKRPA